MSSPSLAVSPFTKVVVEAVRRIYPEELADSSFDNTGLLLEAPYRPGLNNSVLLTIDLTKGVADEAIRRKDSIVIAYHPIIFRGLKSLTLANTQQNSLLRLASEGISVYSPHTAVDAAVGGINDWLADIVSGKETNREAEPHDCPVINAVKSVPEGHEGAGYGRILRFKHPQRLGDIVSRIQAGLKPHIKGLSVATPQSTDSHNKKEFRISSVGLCAGSGGSMLNGLEVDLLFTGELSHHEALAAIEQGKVVITAFHSNTERGFLKARMQDAVKGSILQDSAFVNSGATFDVTVSQVDRDPYEIVRSGDSGW